MTRACLLLLLAAGSLLAQVTQKEIDEAIRKGAEYLKAHPGQLAPAAALAGGPEELVALTLVHTGVRPGEEPLAGLVKKVLEAPLAQTYNVTLQAMLLMCLDPRKYRERIADCGQFLVDSQLPNGQWTYAGSEQRKPEHLVASGNGDAPIALREKANGTTARGVVGDNSNSQFGLLGLWIVSKCGIKVPASSIERAERWWKGCIGKDGGWGYEQVAAGQGEYGSMTCAGVAAMAISGFVLGNSSRDAGEVAAGLRWLGDHFSVEHNPRGTPWPPYEFVYYYLYSLERACTVANVSRIGGHDWYQEGARFLVDRQKPDGSWAGNPTFEGATVETCYAILFLKHATRFILTGEGGARASVTPDDPAAEPADDGKDGKK